MYCKNIHVSLQKDRPFDTGGGGVCNFLEKNSLFLCRSEESNVFNEVLKMLVLQSVTPLLSTISWKLKDLQKHKIYMQ